MITYMSYAYQTEQGREALVARNLTAEYYACIHGLETSISSDPLDPLAVRFCRNGRLDSIAIIRNRTESLSSFPWPSIIVTASKVDLLQHRACMHDAKAWVIIRMADNALLSWSVNYPIQYPRRISTTKGDCIGSYSAKRENMFLPIESATIVTPDQLM